MRTFSLNKYKGFIFPHIEIEGCKFCNDVWLFMEFNTL